MMPWPPGSLRSLAGFGRHRRDVGCSAGLLLEALLRVPPYVLRAGIGPSTENGEAARQKGLTVVTGSLPGVEHLFLQTADMAVTANVISHVADPIAFLGAMAKTIHSEGRIVIYGHDGIQPSADLLWADIGFSFCREHLITIAAKVGLEHINSQMKRPPAGQEDKYVLVFKKSDNPHAALLSAAEVSRLNSGRHQYFQAWRELAGQLARLGNSGRSILNFGASFWSILLAGYCPDYWSKVKGCVVDDEADTDVFLGKPLIPTSRIGEVGQNPIIVLGANPSSHAFLRSRLSSYGEVIGWDGPISR